jgi:hypothetical protein
MKIWLLIFGLIFLALAVLFVIIGIVLIATARKKGVAVAPRPPRMAAPPPPPVRATQPERMVAPPPPPPPPPPAPMVVQAPSPPEPPPHVPPVMVIPPPDEFNPGVTEAIPMATFRPPDNDSTVLASVPLTERGMLVCNSGRLAGQQFDLGPAGLVIGRERTFAQVVLDDPRVSKKHVWVGERDGETVAVDQGSTNGTFLNAPDSVRISEVKLKPGDVLIISDDVARFTFER